MSKKYTFEFDDTMISEFNTALRIMYKRREFQHRYLKAKLGPEDRVPNKTTRKKERFFSIVDGVLKFEETQFIPTRKTPVKKVVENNLI